MSYTQTGHWRRLKKQIWKRANGQCERCTVPLTPGSAHLHHLTYARKGAELPRDVIYLCLNCHGEQHPRHTFVSLAMQRLIAASRKKLKERGEAKKVRNQRKQPTQPTPEKDPAFDHCVQLMRNHKEQRQRCGRRKRAPRSA